METALRVFQDKSLSYQGNFRHYSTAVKSSCLYAAEGVARKRITEIKRRMKVLKENPGTLLNPGKWIYILFEANSRTIQHMLEYLDQYKEKVNDFL